MPRFIFIVGLIGRLSAEWWLPLIYVLCVYGSPRKGGNTEILVKYVADKFKSRGANVDLVRLCDLEIKPCISCRKCVNNRGTCFIDCLLYTSPSPRD